MPARVWKRSDNGRYAPAGSGGECPDHYLHELYLSVVCDSCGSKLLLPDRGEMMTRFWDGVNREGERIGGQDRWVLYGGVCPFCGKELTAVIEEHCKYPDKKRGTVFRTSVNQAEGCRVVKVGKVHEFFRAGEVME